jgi:hypothetical protein
MRSKSFSKFFRLRSDVRVTTSLMPENCLVYMFKKRNGKLTWIFGIFRTNIIVTGVQDILVHQCSTRSNLSEKADLVWFANLDTLALLHKDLSSVLATIFSV